MRYSDDNHQDVHKYSLRCEIQWRGLDFTPLWIYVLNHLVVFGIYIKSRISSTGEVLGMLKKGWTAFCHFWQFLAFLSGGYKQTWEKVKSFHKHIFVGSKFPQNSVIRDHLKMWKFLINFHKIVVANHIMLRKFRTPKNLSEEGFQLFSCLSPCCNTENFAKPVIDIAASSRNWIWLVWLASWGWAAV